MRPTVAIVGAGSMGELLGRGLLRAGWAIDELVMAARRPERAKEAEFRTGITTVLSAVDAVDGKNVVVVSVKPKDVAPLLRSLAPAITKEQLVISMAAGVPISVYERALDGVPVVRSMPNTPAAVDRGITAFCGGMHVGDPEMARAEEVLSAVGATIRLDEELLDAVTAVSGSGPAYVFLLAEALTEAAIREGLPWHAAQMLVDHTLRGAGALLAESDFSPFQLRNQVTSPGGTTAAALHVLEDGGFRALIENAVRAAAARSREMGASADAASIESS